MPFEGKRGETRSGTGVPNPWLIPSQADNGYDAQAGDVILLSANVWAGSATFDGTAEGFTQLGSTFFSCSLWYKVSAGSEPVNWNFPVSDDFLNALSVAIYSNLDPLAPFLDEVANDAIDPGAYASGVLVASGGETAVLLASAEREIGATTPVSTELVGAGIPPIPAGIGTAIFEGTVAGAGPFSYSGSLGGGGAYSTYLVFLNELPPPPPPPPPPEPTPGRDIVYTMTPVYTFPSGNPAYPTIPSVEEPLPPIDPEYVVTPVYDFPSGEDPAYPTIPPVQNPYGSD